MHDASWESQLYIVGLHIATALNQSCYGSLRILKYVSKSSPINCNKFGGIEIFQLFAYNKISRQPAFHGGDTTAPIF